VIAIAGNYPCSLKHAEPETMTSAQPLHDRIALVTGASRGIGKAIALELARHGAHVIALARTQGGLEELDDAIRACGQEATLVPCDLRDYDALDRLGLAIYERWGKLDIVIGNAGLLGPITPLSHIDPPNWDNVLAVNLTANWRLIRSVDALLRAADAGRALFITSGAAHKAQVAPYRGAYATSKAGVEMLARTYAAETQNTSAVKVMCVNPGPLRTKMRAALMPGEDPETLELPDGLAHEIMQLCMPNWQQTGALYDYPSRSVLHWQAPA
jgi:NAD(P)-dependent dehydrogenase (short-subunit alcohol dehydrogenase family)